MKMKKIFVMVFAVAACTACFARGGNYCGYTGGARGGFHGGGFRGGIHCGPSFRGGFHHGGSQSAFQRLFLQPFPHPAKRTAVLDIKGFIDGDRKDFFRHGRRSFASLFEQV